MMRLATDPHPTDEPVQITPAPEPSTRQPRSNSYEKDYCPPPHRPHESPQHFALAARATNDAIRDWDVTTGALEWPQGLESLLGTNRRRSRRRSASGRSTSTLKIAPTPRRASARRWRARNIGAANTGSGTPTGAICICSSAPPSCAIPPVERSALSARSWTSPRGSNCRISFAARRRWKRSASSPAGWRTTLITSSPRSSATATSCSQISGRRDRPPATSARSGAPRAAPPP